jgi:acetolactate synthase-1/2/3 large subunit
MKGYEYIARTLQGYGIDHVFYIEAMLRMSLKYLNEHGIKCVMAHSEAGAGYMADGYARASGHAGVCLAQSIGAANMVGGIGDAWLAGSPVIAITGQKQPVYQYRHAYQEADHRLLFEGVTKFNAQLQESAQLPFLLRQAFRAASSDKPRPVHLDMPNQIGRVAELMEITQPIYIEEDYCHYPAQRNSVPADQAAEAAEAIDASERPILIVGRGAALSGAGAEIRALAAKADIPVVTTPDGKTLIDENDERWAGIVGGYGMLCANQSVKLADLPIFIGTQTSDQTTCEWQVPEQDTKVIQIDIDGTELCKNYPLGIGLQGDARTICAQLLAAVRPGNRPVWRQQVNSFVSDTLAANRKFQESEATPIRPERLCAELSRALPTDAVVVADTGFSAQWSATMMRMRPGQKYFRAAGSLGWAYPASLGVKCALPDRPVLCFTGDGALYYHLGEMETAARNGIRTVTVVNNNGVFAQCSGDIKKVNQDLPDRGARYYTFQNVALWRIAREFGMESIRVEKADDLQPVLQKALAGDESTFIEVITDSEAFVSDPAPVTE